ncbi:hypothetical protein TNCV_3730111 [Trichonephila clavipes]|nr:hypothetical protein TNCV_3730111 [Trichonephila clavipes]
MGDQRADARREGRRSEAEKKEQREQWPNYRKFLSLELKLLVLSFSKPLARSALRLITSTIPGGFSVDFQSQNVRSLSRCSPIPILEIHP